MKYRLLSLLLLFLIPLQGCLSNVPVKTAKKVTVTYVANEGFLIEVNDKSVLIDAMFGDRENGFCDIPNATQIEQMTNAKGSFEDVDIIAVTHKHTDHFYAPFVIDHLLNNGKGKFISCAQTHEDLEKAGNYDARIKSQLVEITPDSLNYRDTTINGIDVRVLRLIHGPYYVDDPATGKKINRHRNMQNLGFIFTIDGVKVFHCGDSSPFCIEDYKHFRLDREDIDIAFLGRGFMWSTECEGLDIIRNYLSPDHIVLMHIHHKENERFMHVAEELKDEFPSVKVFEKRMEEKEYVIL